MCPHSARLASVILDSLKAKLEPIGQKKIHAAHCAILRPS